MPSARRIWPAPDGVAFCEKIPNAASLASILADVKARLSKIVTLAFVRRVVVAEISKRKPIEKNRVDPAIEKAVAEMALEKLVFSQVRVANELKMQGHTISPAGVHGVWLRHNLGSANYSNHGVW